jgi:4-amino-4-deoxy-L-arabinose transferase-like glycosyltransferase
METEFDPYQTPREEADFSSGKEPLSGWSTSVLVTIFFIPAAFFILAFCANRYLDHRALEKVALYLALGSGVVVSVFSAFVHNRREGDRLGTFALLTVVYLLAQVLALMTLRIGVEIVAAR